MLLWKWLVASYSAAIAQFYNGNSFKPMLDAHKRFEALGTRAGVRLGLGGLEVRLAEDDEDAAYVDPSVEFRPELTRLSVND